MDFYIRKNATEPILRLKIIEDGRLDYERLRDRLKNSTCTFSMKNTLNNVYTVANSEAEIVKSVNDFGAPVYFIQYQFTKRNTRLAGKFLGQFHLGFLNDCGEVEGELIAPVEDELYIHILDSWVNSDFVIL